MATGHSFAIVGSGNLSAGGLRDNIECGLYTEDRAAIEDLKKWFDNIYEKVAKRLDEPVIRWYQPLYNKYHKRNWKLRRAQVNELKQLDQRLEAEGEASIRHWMQAVEDAKELFSGPGFMRSWKECDRWAHNIRDCLDYPRFDFGYKQWQQFLKIKTFGNLAALNLYRKAIVKNMRRVREAFRLLTDESKDIRFRLQSVLSGPAKVAGIDMNVITKVLTVHDRNRWPVYNSRVHGELKRYGYELPRGLSKTDKYLAYAELMRRFRDDSEAKDMYAIDRFFLSRFLERRSHSD